MPVTLPAMVCSRGLEPLTDSTVSGFSGEFLYFETVCRHIGFLEDESAPTAGEEGKRCTHSSGTCPGSVTTHRK